MCLSIFGGFILFLDYFQDGLRAVQHSFTQWHIRLQEFYWLLTNKVHDNHYAMIELFGQPVSWRIGIFICLEVQAVAPDGHNQYLFQKYFWLKQVHRVFLRRFWDLYNGFLTTFKKSWMLMSLHTLSVTFSFACIPLLLLTIDPQSARHRQRNDQAVRPARLLGRHSS